MIEEYPLGVMLRVICNHLETQANHHLIDHDLTLQQMLIINYLIMHPNKKINQKELEERFHLKHSTISGLLQRLEKKKLVLRFNCDSDGRQKFIEPTEKALKIHEDLEEFIAEQDGKIIELCSKEELDCLHRILVRLTNKCLLQEEK